MLENILGMFNSLANYISNTLNQSSLLIGIIVYAAFILIYSGFFWNFNKIVSKKDFYASFIQNYFDEKNEGFKKLIGGILRLIKYIIVFPAVILFWFLVFALFLLFLSKNNEISKVLLISASMIIAIRILAFSEENLSRNVAKIIPLTLLAIFIINPSFSDLAGFLDKLSLVKDLINSSLNLMIFIFITEVVLRILNQTSKTLRNFSEKRSEKILIKRPVKKIKRN